MNKILAIFFLISVNCLFGQDDLQYVWSGKLGTTGSNTGVYPYKIVVDDNNNKFICGTFKGTHDFDPGIGVYNMTSLTNTINSTVFVLKLDSLNNLIWANYYGTTGSTIQNNGLIIDSVGNVYTFGSYEGNLFYDSQNPSSSVAPFWWYSDNYVHKINNQGDFEWIKSWGGNNTDGVRDIVLDNEQNFYLLGYYSTSTDANPSSSTYTLNSSTTSIQFYLSKFNSNFDFLWAKQYGGDGSVFFPSLTFNESNELTIAGEYQGQIDFDLTNGIDSQTSNSFNYDLFVHVIDSIGNTKWFKTLNAAGDQRVSESVNDDLKNRYIIGSFNATTNFNPSGIPNVIEIDNQSIGENDTYIMKLDSVGNIIWTKGIQGESYTEYNGLRINSNQLIVFGSTSEKTDIDPAGSLVLVEPPNMISDLIYILKLDTGANLLWHDEFICSDILNVHDLQFDNNNNIFILGQLTGDVDFDPSANVELQQHSMGQAVYISEYNETPCAQLGVYFSNYLNGSCSTQGNVTANPIYGNPPYSINWLTNPSINTNIFQTDTSGLFFVEVEDANGCKDTSSIYIDGPLSNIGVDLEVNLIRPNFVQGQSNILWLDAYNRGCQNTTGEIRLVLNSLINFDSASISPDIISGDTLIWNNNFYNNDSLHFSSIIHFTTSQTAVSGDTVCFLVEVNSSALDFDTRNNSKIYCDPILASYDPNDINVYPNGLCDNYVYINQTLEYTVRFQNTGNYEALHVNIIDTVDQNLDLTTLKVISKSHPYLDVNNIENQCLQFNFLNIHLPDSLSDPIGSNGYVTFSIKPKSTISLNSIITKEVNIYFDYNDPILTNSVNNTVTNDIPCVNTDNVEIIELEKNNCKIFPNPAYDFVQILFTGNNNKQLKVYSLIGELIMEEFIISGDLISISKLSSGIYFFELEDYPLEKIIKN